MKKRATLTAMVLAVSVIFVAAVIAAEQKPPASAAPAPASTLEKCSGVVERVDVAKKDFSVKNRKEEMTFSRTDKTKITEGKKELSFADLKQGLQVTVKYKKEGDKLVTDKISVGMPKAKEKM